MRFDLELASLDGTIMRFMVVHLIAPLALADAPFSH